MRMRRFLFPVLEIPGLLVLFLPFTWGYSPCDVLGEPGFEELHVMAGVAFLAVPILASTVRQLVAGPLSKAEARIAYGLALSALVASVVVAITLFDVDFWIVSVSTWTAALVVAAVCAFNVRKRVPHAVNAHVCLLLAYLPNAIMAVVAFGDDLEMGGYVCLVAMAGHVAEAAVRSGRIWQGANLPPAAS